MDFWANGISPSTQAPSDMYADWLTSFRIEKLSNAWANQICVGVEHISIIHSMRSWSRSAEPHTLLLDAMMLRWSTPTALFCSQTTWCERNSEQKQFSLQFPISHAINLRFDCFTQPHRTGHRQPHAISSNWKLIQFARRSNSVPVRADAKFARNQIGIEFLCIRYTYCLWESRAVLGGSCTA